MEYKEVAKIIGPLSDDELRAYIYAFIEEDEEAGGRLCDFIRRQLTEVGLENAVASVERSFGRITNVGDSWHSNWMSDWRSIESDSYDLFDRARYALVTGVPDIALAIGTRWLECFADNFDASEVFYFDDEGVGLGSACRDAIDIIHEAITTPGCTDDVKKDIAERLNALCSRPDDPFDNYYCINLGELAADVNVLIRSDEDALAYLGNLLAEDFNNDTLIKQKYNLLLKMGRTQDAESFIEENVDNVDVADYYVKKLFEAERFEKLIPILKDLTDPDYRSERCPEGRWLELLAKCQEQLGLKDDLIATYSRLFIFFRGDLKHYRILKKMVDAEAWPQYLKGLLEQAAIMGNVYLGRCNYADILVEEGESRTLHDWLKSGSAGAFANYLHAVPQELRADLLPIYQQLILDEAARAQKRDHYAQVCCHLAKLLELPEGEPLAAEIALQLKSQYSTRPAFMDELRKVIRR